MRKGLGLVLLALGVCALGFCALGFFACENMSGRRADGGAPQEKMRVGSSVQSPAPQALPAVPEPDAMHFEGTRTNPFVAAEDDPLSTFAIDVDTGSYTVCRNYVSRGLVPPKEAVRVEEFVNAARYDYAVPQTGCFGIDMALAPSRYGQGLKNAHLLRIGIQAKELSAEERKRAVLTFVIDVSGSMRRESRLGLVQQSLHFLVDQLDEGDLVGIAAYGTEGREVLAHTSDRKSILAAVDGLRAGGSTNAEEGIRIGYDMAARVFAPGAINRVILCSDGVANVGRTGPKEILAQIVEQRRKGITLSAIGVGMGNYNDHLLEQLGDKGDGHYAYIDSLAEAKRIFVDNLTGTLQVVAREAKIQVRFDPKTVRSWRLIGYENRAIADEDFRNDAVDGGEVGAGHQVTALYELKLEPEAQGNIASLTIRYKHDENDEFIEEEARIGTSAIRPDWQDAPKSLKLAAAAAELAEILRESYWAQASKPEQLLGDLRQLVAELDSKSALDLAAMAQKAIELRDAKSGGSER